MEIGQVLSSLTNAFGFLGPISYKYGMLIGDVEIKGKVVLGPMAGVTTVAYRDFMKPFGVGLSYSEMISDCGIAFGNKRTYDYLETSEIDHPVGLQIFGFDAATAEKSIAIIEKEAKYDILDINLGCPVYKVTKTGAGSSWLKRPEELEEYMKRIVAASHKPVTAKIRLGWDESSINVFDVSKRLERAGVKAISVHCRTKAQGYAGNADYQAIAGLKEQLSVPLIVSGDIFTALDAKKAIDVTHADMVMVARGGLGHPYLVTQINALLEKGETLPDPSLEQQVAWAKQFSEMLIALHGEETAIRELRGLIPHFFSGFPGHKAVRNQIATRTNSKSDLFMALDWLLERVGRL